MVEGDCNKKKLEILNSKVKQLELENEEKDYLLDEVSALKESTEEYHPDLKVQ